MEDMNRREASKVAKKDKKGVTESKQENKIHENAKRLRLDDENKKMKTKRDKEIQTYLKMQNNLGSNGEVVAISGRNGAIYIYSLETGKLVKTLNQDLATTIRKERERHEKEVASSAGKSNGHHDKKKKKRHAKQEIQKLTAIYMMMNEDEHGNRILLVCYGNGMIYFFDANDGLKHRGHFEHDKAIREIDSAGCEDPGPGTHCSRLRR